ncbi:uncharacterized protein C2orf42 homolog isoform X2 [Pyrgilauda ruficollis]|uniref:uncharacterized protein C2orf42 homolog isoform X2 n=1 Tax=Pyrgilauda ruficollis TaxID=221976 RepID=UPI001B87E161|nr:uncharacterized protein C2orf42 homolog isoform X2 [Pyrgilauda ruficollis]
MLGNPGKRRAMDPCPGRPKAPSFLSDLGKATLRGIRKCPRCGTYNGTRGLSCKNKTCGAVFRAGARRAPGADAVRLLSGAHGQLYSVRQRQRRCFVQLGVSQTAIQTPEGTLITQLSSGRCHAPACAGAAADEQCQHLKLALGCQAEATPLPLKSSVLGAVQAPAEAKQSLWELATEPTGPLVQRVTKSVLVVKCKASQRHSLGYLHASFGQRRFSCACRAPGHGRAKGEREEDEEEEEEEEEEEPPARCIHFLACICAFASDESLAQEFSEFLASDGSGLKGTVIPQLLRGPGSTARARGAAAAKAKRRRKDLGPGPQVPGPLLAPDPAHPSPRRSSLRKLPIVSSSPSSSSSSLKRHGRPEPLVFHIPQSFFEALQQRISSGSGKKRLPNSTTGEADLRHARGAAGDHPELRAEPRRLLRALPQPPRGGGEPARGAGPPRETAPAAAPGAADLPQSRTHVPHAEGAHALHHRVDPRHPAALPPGRAAPQVPVRAPRGAPAAPRPRDPPRRAPPAAPAPPGHHRLPLSPPRRDGGLGLGAAPGSTPRINRQHPTGLSVCGGAGGPQNGGGNMGDPPEWGGKGGKTWGTPRMGRETWETPKVGGGSLGDDLPQNGRGEPGRPPKWGGGGGVGHLGDPQNGGGKGAGRAPKGSQ